MCAAPYIVMSAPNGARRHRAQHPNLPVTPDELADCAQSVLEAGAAIIHIHIRDDFEGHSLDARRYRDALRAIRDRIQDRLVVQVTTESCDTYTPQQQMELVRELRPEAVSVALRELLPHPELIKDVRDFSTWSRANGVMVQCILHTPDDASRYSELRNRGVLGDESNFVLFVLGSYSMAIDGLPEDIEIYRSNIADESVFWSVCCFGSRENDAARLAAQSGGHARVGFENNLNMPDGSLAPDNAALVRLAVQQGLDAGRPIADAGQVRAMFAV